MTLIFHPGSDSSLINVLTINGLHGIRRLRAGAPFRLGGLSVRDSSQHAKEFDAVVPGSQDLESGRGSKLLREFCTEPCPQVKALRIGDTSHFYLEDAPLGNMGAQSVYMANLSRGIEWYSTDPEKNVIHTTALTLKPSEVIVKDTLIHRDMFGALTPDVRVYGSLDEPGVEALNLKSGPQNTLPVKIEVHNLGVGPHALPTPHVPRYPEMIEAVCRRAGWKVDDFEVFRCVLEYPLVNSVVEMTFPLPQQGNW